MFGWFKKRPAEPEPPSGEPPLSYADLKALFALQSLICGWVDGVQLVRMTKETTGSPGAAARRAPALLGRPQAAVGASAPPHPPAGRPAAKVLCCVSSPPLAAGGRNVGLA